MNITATTTSVNSPKPSHVFQGRYFQEGAARGRALQLSNWYLTWPERIGAFISKPGRSPWIGKPLKFLMEKCRLFDFDYRELARLPFFGKVVAEIPRGALSLVLFGFTLPGRLKHAIDRAIGGDKRELRDIACRDLPTFVIILYALPIMVSAMCKRLQKRHGIQLVQNGDQVIPYSQLKNMYQILDANRIKSILLNPDNHKGISKAIERTQAIKTLKPEIRTLLGELKHTLEVAKGFINPGKEKQLQEYSEKAFQLVEKLERLSGQSRTALKAQQHVASSNIVNRFIRIFDKSVPTFRGMFSAYSWRARVLADVASFAVIIGILGYGVTWFNKWFTEKEYQKLQAQTPQKTPVQFDSQALLRALQAQNPAAFNAFQSPYRMAAMK